MLFTSSEIKNRKAKNIREYQEEMIKPIRRVWIYAENGALLRRKIGTRERK